MSDISNIKPPVFYGWYIVATVAFVAFIAVGASTNFTIFVIPMSLEFDWNRTTISSVGAIGALVSGLSQPFLGHLFDRHGRKVILISLLIVGLTTIALSFTHHFLFLAIMFGFVLSGARSGGSISNTGALLSRWFHRRRATVLGLNAAGSSLGGLLLVPLGMFLLEATSWRVTWATMGVLVLALALPMAYFFLRNDPAELGLNPDGDLEPPEGTPAAAAVRRRGTFEVDRWSKSFRIPPIWQLSAAYTVCGITTGIISFHLVPYAIGEGISPVTAATIFGFMMGLNALGSLGASMLSDRFRRKDVLAAVYFVRGIGYILLLVLPPTLGLWVFAVFAGFSWVASPPVNNALIADIYGLRALGAITGVSFLCHQVGGFFSILLAGYLFDLTGSYTLPFALAGSLLFPAALAIFTIKEEKYSVRYQTGAAAAAAAAG